MLAAVITGGGGSGCGRAIALEFANAGYPVVVSDIDGPGGEETFRQIEAGGGRARFHYADMAEEKDTASLIESAETAFGGVAVLVNNASARHIGADEGMAGWARVLSIDLGGAIHATRYAIESMRRTGGGSVVNISSISALWHGRLTPGGFAGFDVAKAAMIRMTTVLANEAAADAIRVNCLAPGWIATDGPRQYWESFTPEERKSRGIPSKLLDPRDVARMVLRLATDETLNGRIVAWWSEDKPRLIEWGDRGYRNACELEDN